MGHHTLEVEEVGTHTLGIEDDIHSSSAEEGTVVASAEEVDTSDRVHTD